MERIGVFFRWLGTPIRALRALFPFTLEGRQTLIYLMFSLAGPAVSLMTLWAMNEALKHDLDSAFINLAYVVGWCLVIAVSGLAMFVSLRAVKLGKDGFEAKGDTGEIPRALDAAAEGLAAKAEEIRKEE